MSIGEDSSRFTALVCMYMSNLGLTLEQAKERARSGDLYLG